MMGVLGSEAELSRDDGRSGKRSGAVSRNKQEGSDRVPSSTRKRRAGARKNNEQVSLFCPHNRATAMSYMILKSSLLNMPGYFILWPGRGPAGARRPTRRPQANRARAVTVSQCPIKIVNLTFRSSLIGWILLFLHL